MDKVIEEGSLRFSFGTSWRVEKYDQHRDYREKIAKLPGTRAVDFVGVQGVRHLFLIEVKDFRGSRIENKDRIVHGQLVSEVAHKVRDTLAGLVAAYRRSSEPETWRPFVAALVRRQERLSVVLWLEEDQRSRRSLAQRRAVARTTLTKTLKAQLRWLTTKVAVLDRTRVGLPDLRVSGLQREL